MEKIRYTLPFKYKNYQMLIKKISDNSIEFEELTFLSFRLKKHYENFCKIKESIILNNKPFYQEIEKKDIYLLLMSLKNVSDKYENEKILVNDNRNTLSKGIEKIIDSVSREVYKGNIDVDNIIGVFKLVNLTKELNQLPENAYKMSGLQEGNLQEKIQLYTYGQGFESLNSRFLNESLGLNFKEIPSLLYWDYQNSKRQYKDWSKTHNDKNWDEWYFDKKIDLKDKFSIPSMDLEAKSIDKNTIYVENKNFNVSKQNTFLMNLRYSPENILKRLSKQETLRKHQCDLYYNINVYDSNKNESKHFYIPIEVLKKFYQKLNKQVNMGIKKSHRKNPKFSKIDFKINILEQEIDISLNYSIKGKDFIVDDKTFKISINGLDSFSKLFKDYEITNEREIKGLDLT